MTTVQENPTKQQISTNLQKAHSQINRQSSVTQACEQMAVDEELPLLTSVESAIFHLNFQKHLLTSNSGVFLEDLIESNYDKFTEKLARNQEDDDLFNRLNDFRIGLDTKNCAFEQPVMDEVFGCINTERPLEWATFES